MAAKEFTYQVDVNKSISVYFSFEFDGGNTIVEWVKIHSNYGSGYASNPQIKFYDKANEYAFYNEYNVEKNGKIERESQYEVDENIRGIIKEIFRIAEEQKPKFFP